VWGGFEVTMKSWEKVIKLEGEIQKLWDLLGEANKRTSRAEEKLTKICDKLREALDE
jgi:hypothetical protein